MGTYIDFMGAELWHILHRVVLGEFWELTNTLALMTRRRLHNRPKITLYGICHSSAHINAVEIIWVRDIIGQNQL